MLPIFQSDPRLRKLPNPIAPNIHKIHVLAIKLLVVVPLQRGPLNPKEMRHVLWIRREEVPESRIPDPGTRLLRPECIRLFIRLGIENVVLVDGHPEAEPAFLPNFFIERFAVRGGVVECILLGPVVEEPGECRLAVAEQLRVVVL
jgi:hypothetical protein